MSNRSLLTGALIALGGCAIGTTDQAHHGGPADAPGSGSQHDAAPDEHVDAPASTQHDAPMSSGTCGSAFTGVLATWSFTGTTGSQASTAAASTATGVTAGAVTRAQGLTSVSGATSINSSGWPTTAAADPAKYYTFTLAPPTGCKLALTSLAIDAKASGTGPAVGSIATSADTFGSSIPLSTAAPGNLTLTVSDQTGSVEIRVYGYSATSTAGTMRIQNTLTATGSLH